MPLTVALRLARDGIVQNNGISELKLNDGFGEGGWRVPYVDDDLARLAADWTVPADAFGPMAADTHPGPHAADLIDEYRVFIHWSFWATAIASSLRGQGVSVPP